MKLARHDALPESYDYRDDGCEESPSCLACPLPKCRFDVKGGAQALRRAERDAALFAAHQQGASAVELAETFGLSKRRVYGLLLGVRDGR